MIYEEDIIMEYYMTDLAVVSLLYIFLPISARSVHKHTTIDKSENVVEKPTYRTERKMAGTFQSGIYNSQHPSKTSINSQSYLPLADTLKPSLSMENMTLTKLNQNTRKGIQKVPNVIPEITEIPKEESLSTYKIGKSEKIRRRERKHNYKFYKHSKHDSVPDKTKHKNLLHTNSNNVLGETDKVYLHKEHSGIGEAVFVKSVDDIKDSSALGYQFPVDEVAGRDVEEHKKDKDSYNPTFDIPERYLKIPDSNDKLKTLVGGIKRRHPCVRKSKQKHSGSISHDREYLKLCMNGNRSLRHKNKHKSKQKEKKENNVITIIASQPNNENGVKIKASHTISGLKELSAFESQSNPPRVPLGGERNVVTIKETYESATQTTLNPRSNLKTTSIFPPQLSNLSREKNLTSMPSDMRNGVNFISKCSIGENNDIWKPENLKKLIDELADNQCWQSGALKGLYHLEQDYKHAKDKSRLSSEDINGLDHVICYLLKELKKCKNTLPDFRDKMTLTSLSLEKQSKMTTSTPKAVATKTSTSRQPIMQNGFDLDWEANLLFY